MKKLLLSGLLSVLFLSAGIAQWDAGQTGYEGDNFSLEGAIELFQHSNSIEDFERRLNTEDTWVNNLDLNYDGRIDYIRVEHLRQGNFHAIVLQVPIDRYDVQDIAVIEIEKTGRRRAMLQIVGDEDLYGEEVIVEPFEGRGYSNGRGGPAADYDFVRGYVNVYYWRPVRHIFGHRYRVYVSPFSWSYYPRWWSPWRPCAWNVYRPRIAVYRTNYHIVHVHRVINVHRFYRPNRAYCQSVVQRTNKVRVKHGKKPIRRKTIKKTKKDNLDKRKYTSRNKTTVDRRSTTVSKPRSRNEVKQSQVNPSRSQKDKVKRSTKTNRSSSTRRSTSKINKQKSNTTNSRKSNSSTTSRNNRSQVKKSSTTNKRTTPSSRSKVSRKSTVKSSTTKSRKRQ